MLSIVRRNRHLAALLAVMPDVMPVVKAAQRKKLQGVQKPDKSFVTQVDLESERIARAAFVSHGYAFDGEEKGLSGDHESRFVVLYDPVDGTGPLIEGLVTSTIIAAVYDRLLKKVICCAIAEPVSGRICYAAAGEGTWVITYTGDLESDLLGAERCHVSDVAYGPRLVTYLDVTHGFTKPGVPEVAHERWVGMLTGVISATRIRLLGSNGAHYATVAEGFGGSGAVITTAKGCAPDVAGILLILEAGGEAYAVTTRDGVIREADPLDPYSCDYAVAGNTTVTVRALSRLLIDAIRPR